MDVGDGGHLSVQGSASKVKFICTKAELLDLLLHLESDY